MVPIIFTEHRDTLNYLAQKIRTLYGREEAVVTIHGGMLRDDRRKVETLFKQDKDVRILIATDAAGEGINLQRAHLIVNDSVTREAITKMQMRKFLKFVHDDNCYCKYYEVVYILFHTGMRISEFCGLTMKDIDFENHLINVDHQLIRTPDMVLHVQETKTSAGKRKLPMTKEVED